MDPSQLASELTKLLTPYLPLLLASGVEIAKGAAGEVGKKGLDAGLNTARAIWQKLRPHVEASKAAQEAVHNVANAPDDADEQSNLRYQLKKILTQNPTLTNQLQLFLVQGT